MADVIFSFGVSEGYRTPLVEVYPGPFKQAVCLKPGRHTAQLASFDIGRLHLAGNRRLLGRLEFAYSFDDISGLITVCGTDFASPDALRLVVAMENSTVEESHFCVRQPYDGRLEHDPHWGHPTRLMLGLPEFWNNLARSANDALIAALQEQFDVHERQRVPELSDDLYQSFLVIHSGGEVTTHYEVGQPLESGESVYSIESVFGGTTSLSKGVFFANVIGSAQDHKFWQASSWIELYVRACGFFPTQCTSLNWPRTFECIRTIIGGHVVRGKFAERVPHGVNYVLIVPICQRHNKKDKLSMKVHPSRIRAVVLHNYHNP